MAKLSIPKHCEADFEAIDVAIAELNRRKTKLLFQLLDLRLSETVLEQVLQWDLIEVTVMDKGMAMQLNSFCRFVPNLKFTVDTEQELFTVRQGVKGRRIWKER